MGLDVHFGSLVENPCQARRFVSDVPANVAAAASVSSAAIAWLAPLTQFAQFIAALVAIVAGIYAIAHYRRQAR